MADFFIHPSSILEDGAKVGKGTKIWHFSHIFSKATIGQDCNIGQNVVISDDVILGNNCKVQNNVSLYTGVVCEDDVFLGPSCVFTNVINPRSAISRKSQYKTTTICRGASIGANSTIVCGHIIGEYSLIGAGTVIRENVKPYACMVGNPAKQIGWVGQYGHRLLFNEENLAIEKESNFVYKLFDNTVIRIK